MAYNAEKEIRRRMVCRVDGEGEATMKSALIGLIAVGFVGPAYAHHSNTASDETMQDYNCTH